MFCYCERILAERGASFGAGQRQIARFDWAGYCRFTRPKSLYLFLSLSFSTATVTEFSLLKRGGVPTPYKTHPPPYKLPPRAALTRPHSVRDTDVIPT